jgi:hypothetical protein
MAKNAGGRSLESILQAVKHDYSFEPFTAEDKPQNKNEIKELNFYESPLNSIIKYI